MDLTANRGAVTTTARARGMPAALTLLAATVISLVGLTWDIQWHNDVGPDTFFTLPHLFLYSGSAIAGFVSLGVVLATTAAQRAGRAVDPIVGGRAIRTLGVFAAPAGYLLSGAGAASFLIYGLWDQWWHGLYGFDAVINSPPHIGLLLSATVTMAGTIMVFAAARSERWGRIGTLGALAILLTFSMVTVLGLKDLDGTVSWTNAASGFLSVLLVMVGAGFLGRPGGAVGTAIMVGVIQLAFWWFSPWAARAYAGAVGLPMRDYVFVVPVLPARVPMCLIVVALLIEGALVRGRASRWAPVLAGALGSLVVAVCAAFQSAWIYAGPGPRLMEEVTTGVAGAVLGLLAGFLGWRFGRMLRLVSPPRPGELEGEAA
ncbi:hypothetical protein [Amycolatopsis pigmentata]|uniref:Uncharacterized protein n=1 Tax=Amycolatopsis pigmentata TaxID=450801 RepID=A0ABW5FV07_9PSEU